MSDKDDPSTGGCETCILSKSQQQISRRTHNSEEWIDAVFGRVSFDIAHFSKGWANDAYMSHIWDFKTHMNYDYTHVSKNEAGNIILDWLSLVKNRYQSTPSLLRLDNETSLGFQIDIRRLGITLEYSAPYASAQNGPAERAVDLSAKVARSLRRDANHPGYLWPE